MRFSLLASVLIVGGVSSVVASGHAEAAVIADPVTAITVTPTNPRLSDPVRTDIVWCVPDSATAGDTFEVALPPELVQLPKSFNLRDPDGVLVATALITGTPAVVTFTFNSYVDTHTGVCGTAFFESRLDSSLVPGTSYTLTYVVNHVTTFEPVIDVRPGTTTTGRDSAKKGAFFADPTDECRTVAEACLGWYIESQLGPFNSVTINDTAPAGTTFVCSQVTVRLWSVNANGSLAQNFPPAAGTVSVTCSPGQLQVIASNVPADRLVRVLIKATPAVLDPAGGVTFVNAATVTHVFPDSTVDEDSISAQRRSALVGGDANGVVPPTTTPTSTPPADSTTTSIVSALPPAAPPTGVPPAAEPVLPATGSDTTVLLAGVVVFLVGGFALVIAGSRRRKVV